MHAARFLGVRLGVRLIPIHSDTWEEASAPAADATDAGAVADAFTDILGDAAVET